MYTNDESGGDGCGGCVLLLLLFIVALLVHSCVNNVKTGYDRDIEKLKEEVRSLKESKDGE